MRQNHHMLSPPVCKSSWVLRQGSPQTCQPPVQAQHMTSRWVLRQGSPRTYQPSVQAHHTIVARILWRPADLAARILWRPADRSMSVTLDTSQSPMGWLNAESDRNLLLTLDQKANTFCMTCPLTMLENIGCRMSVQAMTKQLF